MTAAGRGRSRSRGAIEIRDLTFTYPGDRPAGARRRLAADRAGPDRRVRRRDRLGQVDADQPAAAAARSAAGHGVHRRRRRPRDPARATLRGAIGFVPQEPFLFSDTIAENVAFGVTAGQRDAQDGRATRERASHAAAAAVARLDKDVESISQGLRDDRWASAASRCRAARSSAPRWRAR